MIYITDYQWRKARRRVPLRPPSPPFSRFPLQRDDVPRVAAHDGLDVARPCLDSRALLAGQIVLLITETAEWTIETIAAPLDNMNRDAKPYGSRGEAAPEIVQAPCRDGLANATGNESVDSFFLRGRIRPRAACRSR